MFISIKVVKINEFLTTFFNEILESFYIKNQKKRFSFQILQLSNKKFKDIKIHPIFDSN